MASIFELEAMMISRDAILAKVLEVAIGPTVGEIYTTSVEKMDAKIRQNAKEMGG